MQGSWGPTRFTLVMHEWNREREEEGDERMSSEAGCQPRCHTYGAACKRLGPALYNTESQSMSAMVMPSHSHFTW